MLMRSYSPTANEGTLGLSPITLGAKISSLEIGGFVFTETAHKSNQTLPRHCHERANIAFVLNGSFTEIVGKRRFECASHSVMIKPAGEAHANQYGRGGMRGILIEAQPQKLASLHSLGNAFNRVSHVHGAMLSMLAMRIYKEMHLMDSASLLAIEGLSLELIAELSRLPELICQRRRPRWLLRAKEILHEHPAESVSLSGVARMVDIHPVHLAREFRKSYGCTLGEYLRKLRIQSACHKLSTSDLPLVEIALDCGFLHQSHFSRVFKQYLGMTPTQFRSLYRTLR